MVSFQFLSIVVKVFPEPRYCHRLLSCGFGYVMLSVKHLAPQILKAVDYFLPKHVPSLGLAAPAYLMKKGAIPRPGARMRILQYDGWPDWRIWVRVGT